MRTMRARTAFILMILIATIIPGALGEWLIVSIPDSESDVWMTEIGNIFAYESSVRILDDSIGLHSFIRFEDVGVSKSDRINYATLYVHAGYDQGESPDPGASVTIYGIDEVDCTPFSYSGRAWSLSRPYTSASVNWNLSTWGYGWKSVNVTDIVKEIINQYAWEENNSLGFQILGASGSDQEVRTFEDIDHQHSGNHAYLYIQFNDAGERPSGLPDTATWVETYGELDIWTVDLLGDNRTGEGADVNWNLLNITSLTEIDSGTDLTLNNDTWVTVSDYQDQALGAFYNDTGSTNIETFFLRFRINVTDVNNVGVGNTLTPGVGGLSTDTPSGGGGLPYGANGEWVGLITGCQDDDQSWRFLLHERKQGVGTGVSGESQWFDEGSGDMLYVELRVDVSGATKWMSYDVYDDPDFTNSIYYFVDTLTRATGPFRYPQVIPSLGTGVGHSISNQYYTYAEHPLDPEGEYYLVDENGTVVDTWTQEGENFTDIEDLKDFVDDYMDPLGGDPLDPDPGTQGWDTEGPWTRFKMRLYFLFIGLGCFFTPLWAMAYKKFDAVGYAWCFLVMVLGVGLLWSITGI